MRAAIFAGPHDIKVGDRPDPVIVAPTDAVVRVTLTCVCGSDLWYYRGLSSHAPGPIGHEFVGVVGQVGADIHAIVVGDLVVAPFKYSDGTCANCRAGWTSSCVAGGAFGTDGFDGGQGEAVRVPFVDATLVRVPGSGHSDGTMRSLLDVMPTGHHAAVSAGVRPGSVVAVVGDGAVGLCAVIAARRLGAARIIALSRNPARQALARSFGATEVVPQRGEEATEAVLELTDRIGVDAALECVGTAESTATAFAVARPGSMVGFVDRGLQRARPTRRVHPRLQLLQPIRRDPDPGRRQSEAADGLGRRPRHQPDPAVLLLRYRARVTDSVNAGATWVDDPAFRDGAIVWGRVVEDIPDFCRELIAAIEAAPS